MASVNRVVVVGNLTRDPETRQAGDLTIATLRIAVNDRRKVDGEWTEAPNYFDVDCFGRQAEVAAEHLSKGRQVAIDGRLRWREWQTEDGSKRQAVSIVADSVQFIGPRESREQPAIEQPSGSGIPF